MNPGAERNDRTHGEHRYPSDVAFSPTVKTMQERLGSRELYARVERERGWGVALTPDIVAFVEAQTSVFLATANADGQPYIQHRGGPAGFLRVLDDRTIAFADFIGNQQYITLGNLTDNPKAHLFLMDYARRRRVKLVGPRARGRRPGANREAHARGLQGARRSGDRVHGACVGSELSAAYSAALRGRRRQVGAGCAGRAHTRTGGGSGATRGARAGTGGGNGAATRASRERVTG